MSRHDPIPGWARAAYRALLPERYRVDFLRDLARDAERRGLVGRPRAHLWHLGQLASPSTLHLVWRLRRPRAEDPGRAGAGAWLTDLWSAAKGLRREPAFTSAVVGSLGLGIGLTVAVLAVAHAVLLRPPPYEDPDALVFVWNRLDGFESNRLPLSGVQVGELRREGEIFEDVAGIWATTRTVSLDDRGLLVSAAVITPNFFELLGIPPVVGPGFSEEEGSRGENTILVSHDFWRRELEGDADVIGRTLRVEGAPATVVGVLPASTRLVFPEAVGVPARVDLFTVYPWVATANTTGPRFLRTIGRLREGVELETADRAAREVSDRLRRTYEHMAASGDLFQAVSLRDDSTRRVRPLLLALVAGAIVFLVLTCVNVTSLLMARRTVRQKEMALRACLGASRRRLFRLVLTEVALLSVAGAVAGIAVASAGLEVLWQMRPGSLQGIEGVGLQPQVLAATVTSACLVGALALLALPFAARLPADPGVPRSDRAIGGGSGSARRAVVVAELALSMVLVVGAALLGGSLGRMRAVDLGFEPAGVTTFRVGISNRTFPTDAERARLAEAVREVISGLPGVVSVGATSHIPMADWANWVGNAPPASADEDAASRFQFDHRSVTPGYFETIGATLAEGRAFRTDDTGGVDPVVVVDDAYAARVFPDASSVVGREIVATRYVDRQFVPVPATIVGVVGAMRDHDPTQPPSGQVFWPFAQSARWELTYAVRLDHEVSGWPERIRNAVSGVHQDLAVADIAPLDAFVDEALAPLRFASLLGGLFSALAIGLAFLGLYSVIAYSTRQRVGEIGIRLALGARGWSVFGDILKDGGRLSAAGVGLGLAGAWLTTRYLDALLFEIDPLDAGVLGTVAAGLFVISLVAVALPAMRAAKTDPTTTLRP
jgi:predicted permease